MSVIYFEILMGYFFSDYSLKQCKGVFLRLVLLLCLTILSRFTPSCRHSLEISLLNMDVNSSHTSRVLTVHSVLRLERSVSLFPC